MDAINGNTDALNDNTENGSEISQPGEPTSKETNGRKQVIISNVHELAQMISDAVNANVTANVLSTVDLRINDMGGNEWTIRKGW